VRFGRRAPLTAARLPKRTPRYGEPTSRWAALDSSRMTSA
jgi:hypothetical protein